MWSAGIILGMGSANERRHYILTLSLNGWDNTRNGSRICISWLMDKYHRRYIHENKNFKFSQHTCLIFLAKLGLSQWENTLHIMYLLYSLATTLLGAHHYSDVIMTTIVSQITSLTIVYSTVYSGADQSKHQSSASLAFVRGIHRGPVNSPHKWPVTRKMFPFDDVIMFLQYLFAHNSNSMETWPCCSWP